MPSLRDLIAKKGTDDQRKRAGGVAAPRPQAPAKAKPAAPKIRQPLSEKIPPPEPEGRPLCKDTPGEEIPMVHPKPGDLGDEQWHTCLWADSTELGIIVEPPPGAHAWLAIKRKDKKHALLIHRLPLFNREHRDQPY